MGQKKLIRFSEIKTFKNVLEYPEDIMDKWDAFFDNKYSLSLELACGKGEYAVGLGKMYPERNFIGMDIKGNRIWAGAKKALDNNLNNVAFIRSHIDKITNYFPENSIEEIWITFPDPQLRGSKIKKRLTHPKFLRLYQSILQKEGTVNLKTDSPDLYNFTLQVIELYGLKIIQQTDDVYGQKEIKPDLEIKTHYENLDIAGTAKVHYIQFLIDQELVAEKDAILKEMYANHNHQDI